MKPTRSLVRATQARNLARMSLELAADAERKRDREMAGHFRAQAAELFRLAVRPVDALRAEARRTGHGR